jgi:hypothetical protein
MAITKTAAKAITLTKFNVDVETANGNPVIQFQDIQAQTKGEAVNKAKQMLVFTAERG